MKIIVPPITRPILLTDYAPELRREDGAPVAMYVWVNPPAQLIDDYNVILARLKDVRKRLDGASQPDEMGALGAELVEAGGELDRWYATIWSQHADPATHWTPEDVQALVLNDTDPGLETFLKGRTWEAIRGHRSREKKT